MFVINRWKWGAITLLIKWVIIGYINRIQTESILERMVREERRCRNPESSSFTLTRIRESSFTSDTKLSVFLGMRATEINTCKVPSVCEHRGSSRGFLKISRVVSRFHFLSTTSFLRIEQYWGNSWFVERAPRHYSSSFVTNIFSAELIFLRLRA